MALTIGHETVEKIIIVTHNHITKKYDKIILTDIEDVTINPAEPVVVEDGMLKISGHKGTETKFNGVAGRCETKSITREEAKSIGS